MSTLALILLLGAGPSLSIDADRMLSINDRRMFVIGLYENPTDDARLDEVAKAGFNLVQSGADAAALDRLHARGLYAWINTGSAIDLSEDPETRSSALSAMAQEFGAHPALITWEVPDEALWNVWYGATMWRRSREIRDQNALIDALPDESARTRLRELRRQAEEYYRLGEFAKGEQTADAIWREMGKTPPHPEWNLSNAPERAAKMAQGMIEGYKLLRRLDPQRPVWMNHAPRNSVAQRTLFNRAADVVGCDIYPVPPNQIEHSDLADRSLSCVGAYTRTMQEAAPNKPVWMVLQGFAWADLRETAARQEREKLRPPTYDETRFMGFDAIVNGARGILYWGTAYTDKDKPFYGDLLRFVRELADLQPVLSAEDSTLTLHVHLDETWGSLDRGVRVLAKDAPDGVWVLVVNEWSDPLRYTLHGLDGLNGTTYRDPVAGVEAAVKEGALSHAIPAFGVHVLRPSP